jgi:hypothetical protein
MLDVKKIIIVHGGFMYLENSIARFLTSEEQAELFEIVRDKVLNEKGEI